MNMKSQSDTIYIDQRQRLWATSRQYQRFWGHFSLNRETGLYFASGSSLEKIKIVVATYKLLPLKLRALCRKWQLTVSFAEGDYTVCGNASTFFADFTRSTPETISPHLEIGGKSLRHDLILHNLAHEVAHLFWRTRSESQRRAYRLFLADSCKTGTIEITPYVHEFFIEYLQSLKAFKRGEVHPNLHDGNFLRWTEESFCESVGLLTAGPHPYATKGCTVDLDARLQAMVEHLELVL